MKKLITGILLALCLLAAAGCGGTRDTGEKYVAYEIGHVTIMQNAPNGYAFTVEAEGADAISLINTLLGMRIDRKTRRPILKNNVGGLSGPAVFPVAVRMVWQVAGAVSVPVVGMGGISTWEDAVEMMMAGASAVQIGAAMFRDPYCPVKVIEGLERYAEEERLSSIREIVGAVRPW